MPWDIVLPVLGAAAVAVTGYLGWIATVDGVRPERKKIYKVLFVVCTCSGVVLVALTGYLAPKPVSPQDIQRAVEAGSPHSQNNPQNAVQTNSSNPTMADITQAVRTAFAASANKQESDNAKTTPTQPPPPTQISVPEADQTKALKAITSAWTKLVDDWADSRLKDVPESSVPPTEEDRKKIQAFDEKISVEWSNRFAPMANVFLGQYFQINLLRGSYKSCSGVNLGHGERGQLETFKQCARFIQGAADQLK
jgi:hypothetical protein